MWCTVWDQVQGKMCSSVTSGGDIPVLYVMYRLCKSVATASPPYMTSVFTNVVYLIDNPLTCHQHNWQQLLLLGSPQYCICGKQVWMWIIHNTVTSESCLSHVFVGLKSNSWSRLHIKPFFNWPLVTWFVYITHNNINLQWKEIWERITKVYPQLHGNSLNHVLPHPPKVCLKFLLVQTQS